MMGAVKTALAVVLLMGTVASVVSRAKDGLRVDSFRGIPHLVQVECSAQPIESDADLYSISIFRPRDDFSFASMRPWKDECLTSSSFSSCHMDRRNVRHTKLATILSVSEYAEYERRSIGCNVTYESRRTGAMRKESWIVAVEHVLVIA